MDQSFHDPDTLRKTNRQNRPWFILRKKSILSMALNAKHGHWQAARYLPWKASRKLAIKNSTISNVIAVFNAAVSALKGIRIGTGRVHLLHLATGQAAQPDDHWRIKRSRRAICKKRFKQGLRWPEKNGVDKCAALDRVRQVSFVKSLYQTG